MDCGQLNGKIVTIAYNKKTDRYVLKMVGTNEILYSYTRLPDLIRNTNRMLKLQDVAVEDVKQ
ncbi:MAG: hypothetical protein ACYDAO_02740 [Thermoplasmataceae archaeon]